MLVRKVLQYYFWAIRDSILCNYKQTVNAGIPSTKRQLLYVCWNGILSKINAEKY